MIAVQGVPDCRPGPFEGSTGCTKNTSSSQHPKIRQGDPKTCEYKYKFYLPL